MSRYVTRRPSASVRLDDDEAYMFNPVVFDLSVYDVEPMPTGLVDEHGNEIVRYDTQDHLGFFPLSERP